MKGAVEGSTTIYVGEHYEVQGTTKKEYPFNGQPVAMEVAVEDSSSTSLYYLLTDHLGSTSLVLDAGGGVVGEVRYKAWGRRALSRGRCRRACGTRGSAKRRRWGSTTIGRGGTIRHWGGFCSRTRWARACDHEALRRRRRGPEGCSGPGPPAPGPLRGNAPDADGSPGSWIQVGLGPLRRTSGPRGSSPRGPFVGSTLRGSPSGRGGWGPPPPGPGRRPPAGAAGTPLPRRSRSGGRRTGAAPARRPQSAAPPRSGDRAPAGSASQAAASRGRRPRTV